MSKLTDKQKREVITDYASGKTKTYISEKFNISITAVSKILKNEKSLEKFNSKPKSLDNENPTQSDIRKGIIKRAYNELYIKDFSKLSPETLLKIVERLSILEPIEKEERGKIEPITMRFEFVDASAKGIDNADTTNI